MLAAGAADDLTRKRALSSRIRPSQSTDLRRVRLRNHRCWPGRRRKPVVAGRGEGGRLLDDEVGAAEPPAPAMLPVLELLVAELAEQPPPLLAGPGQVRYPQLDVMQASGHGVVHDAGTPVSIGFRSGAPGAGPARWPQGRNKELARHTVPPMARTAWMLMTAVRAPPRAMNSG